MKQTGSMKRNRFIANTCVHIILGIMSVIWLFPVVWILIESFNNNAIAGSTAFVTGKVQQIYCISDTGKQMVENDIIDYYKNSGVEEKKILSTYEEKGAIQKVYTIKSTGQKVIANEVLSKLAETKEISQTGDKYKVVASGKIYESDKIMDGLVTEHLIKADTKKTFSFGFKNYKLLFSDTQFKFGRWFLNTFYVAIFTCLLSTLYVLCVSYTLSRLRFKSRKTLMNIGLILNMFPGFMSMIAIYFLLKQFGATESLTALIFVYSSGQALNYHIAKGFFDTIPRAIDEAAWIDGATRFQVFYKITIPLSKPILIYTVLTSFMAPWLDFIFAKLLLGAKYDKYTVAIGMWQMMQKEFITKYYGCFTAAAVIVSLPIAILFLFMQKYYVEGMSAGAVKG